MPKTAITLEVLPAGFGDCLLVSCPSGSRTWRMLVDTGPDEAYPQLKARLSQLPVGADGKRHIDLFVVSHIDHDHIGGVGLLLSDRSLGMSFGDIWFNAPPQRKLRGVAEGQSLAELLGATASDLPWNEAFGGSPVVTPAEAGGVELTGRGSPRITLLSPTPSRLDALYRVWAKELERLRRKERDPAEAERPATREAAPSLEDLAARETPLDRAVPNGSSIALLVEHKDVVSIARPAQVFSPIGPNRSRQLMSPPPPREEKIPAHSRGAYLIQ